MDCASRSSSPSEMRRCWVPSWRSRSMRRRVSSAAATIRARDAPARPGLGVRDRGGHELRELRDLGLRVRREGRLALRRGGDHAPEPVVDDDRTADRRADSDARASSAIGPEASRSCPPAPDRPSPAPARRCSRPRERIASRRPARRRLAPGGDAGDRTVRLVALHAREIGTGEQADLARDGLEELRRRHRLALPASPLGVAPPAPRRAG